MPAPLVVQTKSIRPTRPFLYLAITPSENMPLYQLDEYAETMMALRISRYEGVAQVQV